MASTAMNRFGRVVTADDLNDLCVHHGVVAFLFGATILARQALPLTHG